MARHRRFSLEFKRQVVLDFLERRMGLRELARKHNLSRNLLSQWVRKYETGQLTDEVVTTVRIAEYEGKIAELERKVGQLTMFQPLPQRAGTCGLRRRARFSGRRGARLVRSLCSALYSFRQLPRPKPDWPERSFVLTPDAQMEIDLETAETAPRLGLDGIPIELCFVSQRAHRCIDMARISVADAGLQLQAHARISIDSPKTANTGGLNGGTSQSVT